MPRRPHVDLADLARGVDLADLWRILGGRVRPGGRAAHCLDGAAHTRGDRTPSVSLHDGRWTCHACGAHGDALDAVQLARGVDLATAVEELRQWRGLGVEAPRPTWTRQRSRAASVRAAAPTVPPVTQRVPGAAELPSLPSLAGAVVELRAAVWALVRNLSPTPAAVAWVERERGLCDVAAAWALGCRDWNPALCEVRELLAANPAPVVRAAGYAADDGRPWWPLRGDCPGLALPVWGAGTLGGEVPPAWRWRGYAPREGGPKTLSQFGTPPGVLAAPNYAPGRVVLVTEGEPDWLAVCGEIEDVDGWTVVGTPAVAAGWTPALRAATAGARVVCVLCHDCPRGVDLATAAVAELGARGVRVVRYLASEREDLADLARAGRLWDRLAAVVDAVAEEGEGAPWNWPPRED